MSTKKSNKPKTLEQLQRALHRASVTLGIAETQTRRARNVEARAADAYRKAQAALWDRLAVIQLRGGDPHE